MPFETEIIHLSILGMFLHPVGAKILKSFNDQLENTETDDLMPQSLAWRG